MSMRPSQAAGRPSARFLARLVTASALCLAFVLTGCSTTQEVTLVRPSIAKPVKTVAQMPGAGNSTAMDEYLESALRNRGVEIKTKLAAGQQKTPDADVVISYIDVWSWDLVMYMKTITIWLYDGETGDVVVSGKWSDSPLHGFRDARLVVDGLVAEMFDKLGKAVPKK